MNPDRPSSGLPPSRGRVVEFDAHIGLGRIVMSDGRLLMFHCAEIADGSRMIEIDTEVAFEIRTKFAREEAGLVTPI